MRDTFVSENKQLFPNKFNISTVKVTICQCCSSQLVSAVNMYHRFALLFERETQRTFMHPDLWNETTLKSCPVFVLCLCPQRVEALPSDHQESWSTCRNPLHNNTLTTNCCCTSKNQRPPPLFWNSVPSTKIHQWYFWSFSFAVFCLLFFRARLRGYICLM